MPVRYDIAAQVPQVSGGGFDPLNAFAQMQAMDYRQQQNALAQMQMAQAQREAQQEQATASLFAQPGFNPLTKQGLMDIARTNPAYFRQYITPFAGYQAESMREKSLGQDISQKTQLFPSTLSKAEAEAGEAKGKRVVSESKAAQEILRDVYLTHSPERPGAFEDAYAGVYQQLKEVAPGIAKRLGPRPDISAIERAVTSGEEFTEARKPMIVEPGKLVTRPTGRPGETLRAVEPQFTSNAMASSQPSLNALAAPAQMIGDEELSPEQQMAQRVMRRSALLRTVPPEDRPALKSQLDLSETVQAANTGLRRLADAGGITQAGASSAENWKAKFRATKAGLALGNLSDSQVAEEYNNLRTIAGIMTQRMAGAIGLTARQMDAAKEMEEFKKILGGDPSAEGLASAIRRLNTINQLLGTGEAQRFESPRPVGKAPVGRGKAGETPKPMGEAIDFGGLKD